MSHFHSHNRAHFIGERGTQSQSHEVGGTDADRQRPPRQGDNTARTAQATRSVMNVRKFELIPDKPRKRR